MRNAQSNTIITRGKPRTIRSASSAWLAIILGVTLPGLLLAGGEQSSANGEYELKAAFLFHFAQFVEWPADAFQNPASPFTYCTVGEDPFHGALNESLRGKSIATRRLEVRHVKQAEEVAGCQIMFIAAGEKKRTAEVMAKAAGHPILIVGENEGFIQNGGMIGFCLEENKIRFEINLEAVERANLKISARLLALAKTVLGTSRGN